MLVVGVVAALASAALVSVVQAARSTSQRPAAAAGQYPEKVTICHRTGSQKNPFVTIRVSRNALAAHLRHGDTMGPCNGQSFTICHKSKAQRGKAKSQRTMRVRFRAVRAHARHGHRMVAGRCKTKSQSRTVGRGQQPKQPKKPKKR